MTPDIEGFAKKSGFKLAANYEAVLADPDIDAVVLATPHSMHGAQVSAAAAAKKHIYCEKPFTLTKEEAESAVAAVKKAAESLVKQRFLLADDAATLIKQAEDNGIRQGP